MAWTAPMTFVDFEPLSAPQMNTFIRDNMLETEAAKASASGAMIVATGRNQVAERYPSFDRVTTEESSTTTSWDDLTTAGPSVQVRTGVQALVFHAARMSNSTTAHQVRASWEVSGASSVQASDDWDITIDGTQADRSIRVGSTYLATGLTPGLNTFTMKYRVADSEGTWAARTIIVFPL